MLDLRRPNFVSDLPATVVDVLEDGIKYPMIFRLRLEFLEIGEVFIIYLFVLATQKTDVNPLSVNPFINTAFCLQTKLSPCERNSVNTPDSPQYIARPRQEWEMA